MNKSDSNIKFPMKFPAGLGYSPAAAGPVGGWSYTPGPGFFGRQPMDSLLPSSSVHFFGRRPLVGPSRMTYRTPSRRRLRRRHSFGYPLMNSPSQDLNERMFPLYPVGPGNTPGGDGGVFMQGMPSFQSYWGFGRKKRSRRSRRSRRSQKSRSQKSRSQKSRSQKSRSQKSQKSRTRKSQKLKF